MLQPPQTTREPAEIPMLRVRIGGVVTWRPATSLEVAEAEADLYGGDVYVWRGELTDLLNTGSLKHVKPALYGLTAEEIGDLFR